MWTKHRAYLISKWWNVSACLSIGSWTGGWYAPVMLDHLEQAMLDYDEAKQEITRIESEYRSG